MLKCDYCEKTFKQRQSLTRHNQLHTGIIQRLSCTLCRKTFGRMDNFRRHFATHGGNFCKPTIYHPREEATVPNSYERPTEVTGRILQTSVAHGQRFNLMSASRPTTPKVKRIPIIILPHRSRTRFYRGYPGRALPRKFPTHPEWHQQLINTSRIQQDLYLSDDEIITPATP